MISLNKFLKLFLPKYQKLILEYKTEFKPRYSLDTPHPLLLEIITSNQQEYSKILAHILQFKHIFHNIKQENKENKLEPFWNNKYLPGLDIIALYTILDMYKPKFYLEIGSGNSTLVAKKSIVENNLNTKIISIDPYPRADIDSISDEIIRKPLENLNNIKFYISQLHENDILFIDNSHRCFPNSDVTVCFLDILPYIQKGVIVHIHDIYLPYDYPQFMCDRFYSEQYLLATAILSNPIRYKTIFPAFFISQQPKLFEIINSVWDHPNTKLAERHGGSYWFQIQ